MDNRLPTPFYILAAGLIAYSVWARKKSVKVSLPPGPSSWPIIGNVLDILASEPWIAYKRLGEKYGDILHIRLLTLDAIVLNSLESAKALLDQRSQNYSSRPYLAANEVMGMAWNTALLPYSDEWRLHRRIFQQVLRAEGVAAHRPMQIRRARELIVNMLEAPSDYAQHFRMHSTTIILSAAYDYDAAPRDDPMVEKISTVTELVITTVTPQVSAVISSFPFLMHIPSWFPGASLHRTVSKMRKMVQWWLEGPFEYVQTKMTAGTAGPSIVRDALLNLDTNEEGAESAMDSCSWGRNGGHLRGTDSVLQVFILAMTMYPNVQKRAQEEIQAVVGPGRLPDFSDRSILPYIEAILRETLRWFPVVPMSLPHCTIDDDIYQGYLFPKGVTVVPNVAMAHDEEKYPDPFSFKPERFFKDDGTLNDDTVVYGFGFGRRICPGRHFAGASVWAGIVNLLAAFKIEAAKDERGNPCKITPEFTSGLTS
ncbi:hypothetical protein HYDPIDRAFT_128765 [Hydnomerulius pinastri MD-312]|nr:hypothetical protein HYDPIDRAFT_128765 [Hydnomerulius pinastri MD-312]